MVVAERWERLEDERRACSVHQVVVLLVIPSLKGMVLNEAFLTIVRAILRYHPGSDVLGRPSSLTPSISETNDKSLVFIAELSA